MTDDTDAQLRVGAVIEMLKNLQLVIPWDYPAADTDYDAILRQIKAVVT